MKVQQTTMDGTATPFYYIEASFLDRHGGVATANLLVDTGAALTHIPESVMSKLNPKPAKPCLVRAVDGIISRCKRWYLDVEIDGHAYCLDKGVATTANTVGLLGLDILDGLDILISNNVMIIEDSRNNIGNKY